MTKEGDVTPEPPWVRLPAALADRLAQRRPAAAEALVAAATATPRFAAIADPKFSQDVDTAVRVALERFVALIGTTEPALPDEVREVFRGLGAAEARDDRGTEILLTALRAAARTLFRIGAAALDDIGQATTDGMVDLSDAIAAFVDELAAAATDGFTRQVRELAGEGDRLRRHLAEMLLRGGATADQVEDACSAIGWRSLTTVVAVLMPSDQARHARFRYSADGLVVERDGDVVLLLRAGPASSRQSLAAALRGRDAIIGTAVHFSAVPESVRLAERTRPLATKEPAGGPAFVDDHLAELALAGHPAALSTLSQTRLAAFAALPESQRTRLLDTLECWLRHWGSRTAVAAELYIHPQTVSYRIRRLRELLGDALDDPRARFELQLVLVSSR